MVTKSAFRVKQLKAYMELHPEHLGQLALYFTRNFYSLVLVHLAANDKQNCYFKSLAKDSM